MRCAPFSGWRQSSPRTGWRRREFSSSEASRRRRTGTNPGKDQLGPALSLDNRFRKSRDAILVSDDQHATEYEAIQALFAQSLFKELAANSTVASGGALTA